MIMIPFVNPRSHLEDAERLPALIESLAAPDPEEARIPISQYLWIVKRHRWKILGFCAAVAIATVTVSARLTPIFESTTTVDVDRRTPPGVVGPEAALSAVNDADQFLSTQMKLVQSDGVLRPVEERFRLRQREGQSSAESAWGGASPIVLKRLRVTRPPNTYLMLISYRSDDPQLAADAANAIAQSYLEYSYDTVISNGTLLDGAVIETAHTDSSVQLSSGTRLSLSPASRARLYADRMILEKGETRIENVVGFHLEALGLVVRPGVRSGGGSSSGRIAMEGNTRLRVAAVTGAFLVWNARGVLVANVTPGSALAFEPQPVGAASATQITGTLTEQRGRFLLTDRVTRVTVEVTGQRLAAYVGQVVGVTGALNVAAKSVGNAPQVIAASQVQSIDNGAFAAVVGGVSAVESRAQPEDVPPGPPPGRPKGPPPGRPKGPPETAPGLSR
jgi:capsular polysaccharide biosynthesis protein